MNQIKFTSRVTSAKNPLIKEKIKYLSNLDYSVEGEINLISKKKSPIFTVILTVYIGSLQYLEESIMSVINQTYTNVEFILIDHGAPSESKKLIHKLIKGKENILLITFKKNTMNEKAIYSLDLDGPIAKIWDAGLFASKGDLVYFLSDDDKLSKNYVEKMIELFLNNNKCFSAAPRVVSINENSLINKQITQALDMKNTRGRYTSGIFLAKSIMNNENLVAAPGGLLAQKSNLVIENGGFDFLNDITQFFRFAIYGDSGYEDSATLFWRHHPNQTNKETFRKGTALQYRFLLNYLKKYRIYELHKKVCGKQFADKFQHYLYKLACKGVYDALYKSLSYSFESGLKVLTAVLLECPFKIKILSIYKFPYYILRLNLYLLKKYLKQILKKN